MSMQQTLHNEMTVTADSDKKPLSVFSALRRLGAKISHAWYTLMAMLLVLPGAAFAQGSGGGGQGIPTMEDPSRGAGAGIFETSKNYAYDMIMFTGLVICAVAFIGVAWYSMAIYSDIQKGKRTWSDFGGVFMIGVILVIIIIWLINKGTEIL